MGAYVEMDIVRIERSISLLVVAQEAPTLQPVSTVLVTENFIWHPCQYIKF